MTFRQTFETYPEPYRTQAIENFTNQSPNDTLDRLPNNTDVLICAFAWGDSPQGEKYWVDFHNSLQPPNYTPKTTAASEIMAAVGRARDRVITRLKGARAIDTAEELAIVVAKEELALEIFALILEETTPVIHA